MTDVPTASDFPIVVNVPVAQPAWSTVLTKTLVGNKVKTYEKQVSISATDNWNNSPACQWLIEQNLLAARDYWDEIVTRDMVFSVNVRFKDKGMAALFKLTFGGQ